MYALMFGKQACSFLRPTQSKSAFKSRPAHVLYATVRSCINCCRDKLPGSYEKRSMHNSIVTCVLMFSRLRLE